MKQALIEFYLDWFNNYLTVDRMAEHYDIPKDDCNALIEMGRKLNDDFVYTTDGKNTVYAGDKEIARSYITRDGYEVRILQGMNRTETINKILRDCPEFCEANGVTKGYHPKLFSN